MVRVIRIMMLSISPSGYQFIYLLIHIFIYLSLFGLFYTTWAIIIISMMIILIINYHLATSMCSFFSFYIYICICLLTYLSINPSVYLSILGLHFTTQLVHASCYENGFAHQMFLWMGLHFYTCRRRKKLQIVSTSLLNN